MKVQVADYDAYHVSPTKLDSVYGEATQAPIVRVYGSVRIEPPLGTKRPLLLLSPLVIPAMVHIHNYYPYLYVDCNTKDLTTITEEVLAQKCRYLEARMVALYRHRQYNDDDDDIPPVEGQKKFVLSLTVCKGMPIYGYRAGYRPVYKITLLNAQYKLRMAQLFWDNSVVLDSELSKVAPLVYEAHIPYTAQFMSDYNVFGCGWMELESCYVRDPVIGANVFDSSQNLRLKQWLLHGVVHQNNVLLLEKWPRISNMVLEFDVDVALVLNRKQIELRKLHHGFTEWHRWLPDLPTPIYLLSLQGVYHDLEYQCRARNAQFHKDETLNSQSYGTGRSTWLNQEELDDLLAYAMKQNGTTKTSMDEWFDTTCQWKGLEEVPTCFALVDIIPRYHNYPFRAHVDLVAWRLPHQLWSRHAPILASQFPRSQPSQPKISELPTEVDEELSTEEDTEKDDNSENDDVTEKSDNPTTSSPATSPQQPPDNLEVLAQLELWSLEELGGIDQVIATQRRQTFTQSNGDGLIVESMRGSQLMILESQPSVTSSGGLRFRLEPPKEATDPDLLNRLFIELGALKIDYPVPHFDTDADQPLRPFIFANKRINVPVLCDATIPDSLMSQWIKLTMKPKKDQLQRWRYVLEPPRAETVAQWFTDKQLQPLQKWNSQIEAITQNKYLYNSAKVVRHDDGYNAMTYFYIDVLATTDSDRAPDPATDSVVAIFYHFDDSNGSFAHMPTSGTLLVGQSLPNCLTFTHESDMVAHLVHLVTSFDPDILVGYEVNDTLWGYLVQRFRQCYDANLLELFSRGTFKSHGKWGDRWGFTHTSLLAICGRHVLNLWRVLRSDMALTDYSLENVARKLLKVLMPRFSNYKLGMWFNGTVREQQLVLRYFHRKIETALKIIAVQEIITRNVEYLRLIGIDFNANFYRGSQFKVELILGRLSKAENVMLNSPLKHHVHEMRSLECIPLILEPDLNFYRLPLVVLDFQSLYPLIMIAYNYCFSTILCRLRNFKRSSNRLGYLRHHPLPPGLIDLLWRHNAINVLPNGCVFVNSKVRKLILAKMLGELMNTRQAVKKVMKMFGGESELCKLYHARQLALKLIANVTYGYALASFSGRMPNLDVADAIVATGREILLKLIRMIEAAEFGAKVVYGDTDSLFVYFPGALREDAFNYGQILADRVTVEFPDPIFLKFEKVYHPCVLLAKKRYVGYSYELPHQGTPKFDAKGIETVRRDGIPAQQKMVEQLLRLLFDLANLSAVKKYVTDQFRKVLLSKVPIPDFCFAKEVRWGTYKDERYLPPGAVVAQQMVDDDPRKEPQYRERVPYLIYHDVTKPKLRDRAISPEKFMALLALSLPLYLDYEYYITKVLLPPLERIFNLMGANVKDWYNTLPKRHLPHAKALALAQFVKRHQCAVCQGAIDGDLDHFCQRCLRNEALLVAKLMGEVKYRERKLVLLRLGCKICVGNNTDAGTDEVSVVDQCLNQLCDVYYKKAVADHQYERIVEATVPMLKELEW